MQIEPFQVSKRAIAYLQHVNWHEEHIDEDGSSSEDRLLGAELPEVLVVVVACAHGVERVGLGASGLLVRGGLRLLYLCLLVLFGCAPVENACAKKSSVEAL